ncbi:MAG: methyl-accepting chemotaxis protein [Deltaproteobacteria bacterium]|nr:methyl-accepting chemotaxis protein [Deltaproteobacteria bacterium]
MNYSDNVEIEGKDATEPLTEMEMDGYMENEFGFEYYTRAIPLTHDRNAPAPEGVFWTEPYLDYTANIVLISAASPLNDDGKALGVVFVDLSLETLGDILSGIANRYDNPVALTFSYGSHNIFGALGLDDFKPREEADPENLGEKTVKLFKLDDVPLAGPKVVSMMDGMKPGDIKVDEIVYNNKTYTIIVANQSDLFGLMLLIPHEEIFADTIKARELMTSLYETQERDLARVRAATLMSLILILAIMTVVIIFVRNATKKLVELAWSLDREAQEISQISDNTSEVAAALDDQSAEQLRSLSKTSDAMKEISEQISFSVQSSKECSEAMKESALEVEKGEKIASTVRKTMDAISNTTNEISRILTSMQGIAFQTNLLALNASVEAARAGELGQGFAVVAGEVRTLSMRSNEAAQKTESLMEGAITGSRDGEKYAQALTEGFERIGTAASNASGHVKTINQASQEQKHAVDRVADNLDELNETVERNNNLAQKSLDNSHALSGKAESLNASALELKKLLLGKHPARMDSDSYIDHASQFNVKASSLRLTDK